MRNKNKVKLTTSKKQENVLIINDVRSVVNIGAMFRTADAVGINKIYLTGFSPCPLDRFGKVRKDIAKSALGAEGFVPWEYKKMVCPLIAKLKREGYMVIGVEQADNSIDYKKVKLQQKNVFIMGAEVTGIPKNVLEKCDIVTEIPMKGKKESLNVSVACGVVLFRVLGV
jgi:tRNA G18 (ribose-2'-O)-methylase SpoU